MVHGWPRGGARAATELYLSHKGQSVAKRHYLAQDFANLADALVKMREALQPVFAEATGTEQAQGAA